MTQQQDYPANPSPNDLLGVSLYFVAKRGWWEIPRLPISFPLERLNDMLNTMFRDRIFYLAEENTWQVDKLIRVANEAFGQLEGDPIRAYFKSSFEHSLELFPESQVNEIYKTKVGHLPPFSGAAELTDQPSPTPPTPPSP